MGERDEQREPRGRKWRYAAATLLLVGAVGAYAIASGTVDRAQDALWGRTSTSQFYGVLSASPLESYGKVLVIGHNSGESAYTVNRALTYGADVIEIDVAQRNGRLIAAHDSPTGLRSTFYRGLSLEQAWDLTGEANLVQLDLKERSPGYLERVYAFLERHRGERAVMVSTRDPAILRELEEREPDVLRFLSIGDAAQLQALLDDPDLADHIDGVSVRHTLLTTPLVEELRERDLVIVAWTVNSLDRVNDLVEMGVTGITTDNLAILELLHRLGTLADLIDPEP